MPAQPLTDRAPSVQGATHVQPRGPLSEAVLQALTGVRDAEGLSALASNAVERALNVTHDDDLQLALFVLYASSYGSLETLDPTQEWNPELIETRRTIERAFEQELRERVPLPDLPEPTVDDVARALFALTVEDGGPSLSRYLAKRATEQQALEFLVQRSIYTLREADPHSWAIPRLTGRPKAALVEIQSHEYGGGRPDRVGCTRRCSRRRCVALVSTPPTARM